MSIEQIYNKVAKTYNQSISAEVLSAANNRAYKLLQSLDRAPNDILSLGVGDGHFMLPYKKAYPKAKLHGLDISKRMLDKAEENLDCEVYHGDIADTAMLVKDERFDLVLAHFVCAYVAKTRLLDQCHQVLNPGGMISIVTNTHQSLSNMRRLFADYLDNKSRFRQTVKQHVDNALRTVHVPHDLTSLKSFLNKNHFEVCRSGVEEVQLTFNHVEEFHHFFIHGGWFVSGLLHRYFPPALLRTMFKRLVNRHIPFPFTDTLNIAVVLAEKTS